MIIGNSHVGRDHIPRAAKPHSLIFDRRAIQVAQRPAGIFADAGTEASGFAAGRTHHLIDVNGARSFKNAQNNK